MATKTITISTYKNTRSAFSELKNLVFGWVKPDNKYDIVVESSFGSFISLDTWLEKIDFKKLLEVLRVYFDYFSEWWFYSDPDEVIINLTINDKYLTLKLECYVVKFIMKIEKV